MNICLIIPVHNEERRILNLCKSINSQTLSSKIKITLFFLLDGCTDLTKQKLESFDWDTSYKLNILKYEKREGKLATLNKFIVSRTHETFEYFFLIDSDVTFSNHLFENSISQRIQNEFLACYKITFEKQQSSILNNWSRISSIVYDETRSREQKNKLWYISGNLLFMPYSTFVKIFPIKNHLINDDAYLGLFSINNNIEIYYFNQLEIVTSYPNNLFSFLKQKLRVRVGFYELTSLFNISIHEWRMNLLSKAFNKIIEMKYWNCIPILIIEYILGVYSKFFWKVHRKKLLIWNRINNGM